MWRYASTFDDVNESLWRAGGRYNEVSRPPATLTQAASSAQYNLHQTFYRGKEETTHHTGTREEGWG